MPFYSKSSPLDEIVEKATSERNLTENWGEIMNVCDRVSRSSSGPKDGLNSILKRVDNHNPKVSLQALTLLDACVNNCGKHFYTEVCSRDFVGEVRNLLRKIHRLAALKLKGMIKEWVKMFKNDPQLSLISILYEELKREKEEFPQTLAANITLSSLPAKETDTSAEEHDLALAIQMSLKREKEEFPQTLAANITLSSLPAKETATSAEEHDLALSIQMSLNEANSSQSKTPSLYPSVQATSQSTNSMPVQKVRALYEFNAGEDNEVSFKSGDVIIVTDNSDANWWKGEVNGRSGLFPTNFVTTNMTPDPKQASASITQPVAINEEKLEQCLVMLKNANVEEEDDDEETLIELEETCRKMAPLIADKIQVIQKKHDDLTDLNDSFLQAISKYQKLKSYMTGHPSASYSPGPSHPGLTQIVADGMYQDGKKLLNTTFTLDISMLCSTYVCCHFECLLWTHTGI
ncbi:signal transducing adapter molecule 1-like isoform X1 [Xenia sp. Carnegie-2017]|uniref:signal transducing adapter molecule 1-like isoform X1 n=1 Tax=Xenia sp. Carnegie-2017 TaxID=2897299 RepID=UPI001F0367A8|nr:signal transducing adapter molecule 1-like isoform X1 [Xenia sp. Carnegie-2017]